MPNKKGFTIKCRKCNQSLIDIHATSINWGNASQVKLVCLNCGYEDEIAVVQVRYHEFNKNLISQKPASIREVFTEP